MNIQKHNIVISKIVELSYDHHLSTNDIQGLIWTQFNEDLSTDFINSIIASYMIELDDQADDDRNG